MPKGVTYTFKPGGKMKTVIVGAGGVGGFFGGILAEAYSNTPGEEVVFIARGEHGKAMSENGLILKTDEGSRIISPLRVVPDPGSAGKADLILLAVKNYHLPEILPALNSICHEKSVLIPLQNGLGNTDLLRAAKLPGTSCDGLVYVISEIEKPGVIRRQGAVQKLIFGVENESVEPLKPIESYLSAAGISVVLTDHPTRYKWLKFQFIGALSAVTAAHNLTIGQVLENPKTTEAFISIMEEIECVAKDTGIQFPESALQKSFGIARNSPFSATTSFQRDYSAGRKHELEAYLGSFIQIASRLKVPVPVSEAYYRELNKKPADQ